MIKRTGSALHLATPLKAWVQRFAMIFLLTVAVSLMLLTKAEVMVVDKAHMAVTDAVAPILDAASRPVASAVEVMVQLQELNTLRAENAALRADNERLLRWQLVARRLEAENDGLQDALRMVPDPAERFVTARVIGDHGGAFVRSVLLSAGARDGVRVGQAALANSGLAGRVAQVGQRSARVLLVTDMNSRIPVIVGSRRNRAILAGDNSKQPMLDYLGPQPLVRPGDPVLTSGHGGVFPPGLPIGVVTTVEEGAARVQPYIDGRRLEYLRVVDYELPGILLSADEPGLE